MKIRWSSPFGTTEFESTAYEPTHISWPHPAPDPRNLREERDHYRNACERAYRELSNTARGHDEKHNLKWMHAAKDTLRKALRKDGR